MTAPFIARPELLDADPRTATGRPVGWGVIGPGRIAATVTADLALLPDAVLQAVERSHRLRHVLADVRPDDRIRERDAERDDDGHDVDGDDDVEELNSEHARTLLGASDDGEVMS